MDEIIEWLNSDEGIEWSARNHRLIGTAKLITIKGADHVEFIMNQAYEWNQIPDRLLEAMIELDVRTNRATRQITEVFSGAKAFSGSDNS